jgi:hypothetical protein
MGPFFVDFVLLLKLLSFHHTYMSLFSLSFLEKLWPNNSLDVEEKSFGHLLEKQRRDFRKTFLVFSHGVTPHGTPIIKRSFSLFSNSLGRLEFLGLSDFSLITFHLFIMNFFVLARKGRLVKPNHVNYLYLLPIINFCCNTNWEG